MKAASRGFSDGIGDVPHQPDSSLMSGLRVGTGDGREQGPGIGMQGFFVNTLARAQLDDVSQIHYGDPIGNVTDYREIVGNENIRKVEFFL
jgi:hypothetical protein